MFALWQRVNLAVDRNQMTNRISEIPLHKAARVAGLLYLTLIISGIFAEFFVRSTLIVPGDSSATANNIMASEGVFRASIAGGFIMIICDIALALIFYVLLKPVNKSLSLLAAFFRLTQASILGFNLLNLFFVLQLLSGEGYLTVFSTGQLHSLVLLFLEAHSTGYAIGLVFFGINCFILGYLIFKSGYIPKTLGILLIVASFGYLIDSFANFLLPNYESYENIFLPLVFVPAFIAELSLCLWLLVKGIKIPKIKKGT